LTSALSLARQPRPIQAHQHLHNSCTACNRFLIQQLNVSSVSRTKYLLFVLTLFTLTHIVLDWTVVVSFQLYLDPPRGYASHVIRVESIAVPKCSRWAWLDVSRFIPSLVIAYSICFIALSLLDKYTPSAVSITGSYLQYLVGDNIKNLNDVVSLVCPSRIEPIDTHF